MSSAVWQHLADAGRITGSNLARRTQLALTLRAFLGQNVAAERLTPLKAT